MISKNTKYKKKSKTISSYNFRTKIWFSNFEQGNGIYLKLCFINCNKSKGSLPATLLLILFKSILTKQSPTAKIKPNYGKNKVLIQYMLAICNAYFCFWDILCQLTPPFC